ncbi:chromosome segregation protein [Actinophytocola sp.]|uniref:chromosome segregation protein n=1 Tax=Actinophytocola sp. TaxID=1872138 RepID=UPI00389A577F
MALGEERDLVPLGAGFDISKRGYNRMQVEEHLEQLDSQLKILAADRNAAATQAAELTAQLEQARTTIDDLNKQVERLAQPPTTLEGLSERLQRMLRLTQEECEEMRAKATAEADHTRAKAQAEAEDLKSKHEVKLRELDERRIEMEKEHAGVLEIARRDAEELIAKAKAEAEATEIAAAARRQQVEEDFDIAMASRRTESMRALAEQEATSKAEAERRVREATEEANRRRHEAITEATARLQEAATEAERRVREATDEANRRINHAAQRVAALRKLRAKVAEQLTQARELVVDAHAYLENAVPAFEPLPEELADAADAGAKPSPAPRDRNPLPGPPKEKWEAAGAPDEVPIPKSVADQKTKRIAR